MDRNALEFYAEPGRFTSVVDPELPDGDITSVVDFVQGLLVYDMVAEGFYGAKLTEQQADAIHERDSARLLDTIRSVDSRPLSQPRPPGDRVGARCHAFSRLTVAALRAAGVPARARCGFASYFLPGSLEDHWVAEYWNAATQRWTMVDTQLDATWRELINFRGDRFAITSTEFVTAGHAWQAWRRGDLDAGMCGLTAIDEHGSHWIANNLRMDLASLNKVEMLPWDAWGAGWEPGEHPTEQLLESFDSVAALTVDPDSSFAELRRLYQSDDSLHVGTTVFNVARGQTETV